MAAVNRWEAARQDSKVAFQLSVLEINLFSSSNALEDLLLLDW